MKSRVFVILMLLIIGTLAKAQTICDPSGNVMIYSNYEGGVLNIDVDVDIPNLKIGISTYEPVTVNISGAFVGNVTGVMFAGFNEPLAITGVPAGIITTYAAASGNIAISPYLSEYEILGVPIANCMVGAESCTDFASGGANSSPQIVQFFLSEFGPGSVFYAHYTDYVIFPATTFQVSDGGNCCLDTPLGDPNPIYVGGTTYDFLPDTLLLCDDDITLDISFYPTLWGTTTWSTGDVGATLSVDAPGTYSFTMYDYCHYDPDNLLTDTVVVIPCFTEVDASICSGDTYTLPDGVMVNAAGTYIVTIPAADGSDSTISVTLSLLPEYSISLSGAICDGAAYVLPDGSAATTPGTYVINLLTVDGCDSIITVDLSVSVTYTATVNAAICDGETYTLPDGIVVNTAGTYVSDLFTVLGCDSTITTNLSINPSYSILWDTTVCSGAGVPLPDGTLTFTAGTYVFNFSTTAGCDSSITATVDFFPPVSVTITSSDVACLDAGLLELTADPEFGIFQGDGVSGTTFDPAAVGPGTHEIEYIYVDANGCVTSVFQTITVEENFADAGNDTTIYDSGVAELNGITGGSYVWSPADGLTCLDCPVTFSEVDYTTTYYLQSVSANGCLAIDSVTVFVLPSNETVFIPNTFTPNEDGVNDLFGMLGPGIALIDHFVIYDRWGERIWEVRQIAPDAAQWDGMFAGTPVSQGVYAYVAKVQFYSGRIQVFSGNVTLVR